MSLRSSQSTLTHCSYNLGHHRIPSNKFLVYDHAVRIPMVSATCCEQLTTHQIVFGPGIPHSNNTVLGSNVDYAPTWLGLAGIPTPEFMDGRSILSQIIPKTSEHLLLPPTRKHVQAERAALAKRPWRTAQFMQYYNQGTVIRCHLQARCNMSFKADLLLNWTRPAFHGIFRAGLRGILRARRTRIQED